MTVVYLRIIYNYWDKNKRIFTDFAAIPNKGKFV